jgi:hypothetical protein
MVTHLKADLVIPIALGMGDIESALLRPLFTHPDYDQ